MEQVLCLMGRDTGERGSKFNAKLVLSAVIFRQCDPADHLRTDDGEMTAFRCGQDRAVKTSCIRPREKVFRR